MILDNNILVRSFLPFSFQCICIFQNDLLLDFDCHIGIIVLIEYDTIKVFHNFEKKQLLILKYV